MKQKYEQTEFEKKAAESMAKLAAPIQSKEEGKQEGKQEGIWEVHKQRKSGIGNTGYGYAVLMPRITKEGEYKGQVGGYHVIIHQDEDHSKEWAEELCKIHNQSLQIRITQLEEMNKMLFDSLAECSPIIDGLINRTPTGKARNELCDLNIKTKTVIEKYSQSKQ